MIDPITAGGMIVLGAIGFAQGFVGSWARRERYNPGESEAVPARE